MDQSPLSLKAPNESYKHPSLATHTYFAPPTQIGRSRRCHRRCGRLRCGGRTGGDSNHRDRRRGDSCRCHLCCGLRIQDACVRDAGRAVSLLLVTATGGGTLLLHVRHLGRHLWEDTTIYPSLSCTELSLLYYFLYALSRRHSLSLSLAHKRTSCTHTRGEERARAILAGETHARVASSTRTAWMNPGVLVSSSPRRSRAWSLTADTHAYTCRSGVMKLRPGKVRLWRCGARRPPRGCTLYARGVGRCTSSSSAVSSRCRHCWVLIDLSGGAS